MEVALLDAVVIDDDEAVRDSVEFMLDAAGLGVRTWDSAKRFLDAGPADGRCIVTDVRMPDMTGLDLVRALRERGVATPVIVITGHADVPLAVEAMKAGVVDFIEKPFENQRLLGERREEVKQLTQERDELRNRVSLLDPRHMDPDLTGELLRSNLNVAHPDEMVMLIR